MAERFLQLSDVADVLNISYSQAYALVRNGELIGIRVGGKSHWRVEPAQLEAYIQRCYDDTKAFVATHPRSADRDAPAEP